MKTKNYIEANANVDTSELIEHEISKLVFEDAEVNELRGLSDVFSLEQIQKIAENKSAGHYRDNAMYMLANED